MSLRNIFVCCETNGFGIFHVYELSNGCQHCSKHTLLITGQGDVIQPTDGIVGIGSGGPYAIAAARALARATDLPAADIVRRSLEIAAEIDIYTNREIIVEELPCRK